jgi:hypothetical protein
MKFMFLIYLADYETRPDASDEGSNDIAEHIVFARDVLQKGKYITCEALDIPSSAKTVRVRGGKTMRTDGPFAETKEALGGFYLLDCKDLDEALELAARIPPAKHGSIEVRPVMEIPGWDDAIRAP